MVNLDIPKIFLNPKLLRESLVNIVTGKKTSVLSGKTTHNMEKLCDFRIYCE